MAKQTINQGTAPTGAGGDTFRSGSAKLQANDDELYNFIGGAANTTTLPAALPITKGGTGATTIEAAATILACIGAGQTWQQKKTQRALNTRYINTTGRVMLVAIRLEALATGLGGIRLAMYLGPYLIWQSYFTQTFGTALLIAVENGKDYGLDLIEGVKPADFSIEEWLELIP